MFRFVTPPLLYKTFYNELVWNITKHDKTLYLTFDDGPTPGVTNVVLDLLDSFNAKATFFCLGKNVKSNPNLFNDIISQGHTIGNHTYSHLNGWNSDLDTYIDDVNKCREVVNSKLFRPPYGKIKPSQLNTLKNTYQIIMWSVLSYDFDNSVDSDTCLNYVKNNTKNGSVIVFHDSLKAKEKLLYVLPKILESYSKLGYSFKNIRPELN